MSVVALPDRTGAVVLAAAVDRYLESIKAKTTRASYAETLARLVDVAGADRPTSVLTPEAFAAVMAGWDGAAPATWNRHLSALTSFTTWPSARRSSPLTRPGG